MTFNYVRPLTAIDDNHGFGQALKRISQNSDGTYEFETNGSDPMNEDHGYLTWASFTRIDLVDDILVQEYQTSANGSSLDTATSCTVERIDAADLVDGT